MTLRCLRIYPFATAQVHVGVVLILTIYNPVFLLDFILKIPFLNCFTITVIVSFTVLIFSCRQQLFLLSWKFVRYYPLMFRLFIYFFYFYYIRITLMHQLCQRPCLLFHPLLDPTIKYLGQFFKAIKSLFQRSLLCSLLHD